MTALRIEWDKEKNKRNKRKHGVSFEEAMTVFSDQYALLIDDPEHSQEERFILLGLSAPLRTLVVCHGYREEDDVIRIISARKASGKERKLYNQRWTT